MAKQRFTIAFREALWEAHNRKCIYCEMNLAFNELKVDHIIPESILDDLYRFNNTKTRYGLDDGFNIRGYENLAPSCEPCNSKKSDLGFAPGYAAIILSKVNSKIENIKTILEKSRQERDLDSTLRHISRSIEAKKFTADDLIKVLEIIRKFPGGIHGSSPKAPPASPEQAISHLYLHDRSRIVWTQQALEGMRRLDMTAQDLNNAIFLAIKCNKFKIEPLKSADGQLFSIRLSSILRAIYSVEKDHIIISDISSYIDL